MVTLCESVFQVHGVIGEFTQFLIKKNIMASLKHTANGGWQVIIVSLLKKERREGRVRVYMSSSTQAQGNHFTPDAVEG